MLRSGLGAMACCLLRIHSITSATGRCWHAGQMSICARLSGQGTVQASQISLGAVLLAQIATVVLHGLSTYCHGAVLPPVPNGPGVASPAIRYAQVSISFFSWWDLGTAS